MKSLVESIRQYIELQKQKLFLSVADKVSRVIADAAARIVFLLLGIVSFIMVSFGFAIVLNTWLKSPFWGFFIMAAFFASAAVFFYYAGKKWLTEFIVNDILNLMYEDEEQEGESV